MGSPLVSLPLYGGRNAAQVNPAFVAAIVTGRGDCTVRMADGHRYHVDLPASRVEALLWPEPLDVAAIAREVYRRRPDDDEVTP